MADTQRVSANLALNRRSIAEKQVLDIRGSDVIVCQFAHKVNLFDHNRSD